MSWPLWAKCVCCWKEEEGFNPLDYYGNKKFVILPCLHVICATGGCYQKVFRDEEYSGKSQPFCPSCIRTVPAFLVEDLMRMKPLEIKKQDVCTLCVLKGTAVSHCPDCDLFLCADCHNYHKLMMKTSSHVVSDLSKMPSPMDEKSCSEPKCGIHSQILTGYCKSCDAPLCAECLGGHGSCEIVSWEESVGFMTKNVEEFKSGMWDLVAGIQKLQSDVQLKTDRLLTTDKDDLFREAKSIQTQIFDKLNSTEQRLRSEIRKNYKVSGQLLRLEEIQCSPQIGSTLLDKGASMVLEMEIPSSKMNTPNAKTQQNATNPHLQIQQQFASLETNPSVSTNSPIATSDGPPRNLMEPHVSPSTINSTPPQSPRQVQPNISHQHHQKSKDYAAKSIMPRSNEPLGSDNISFEDKETDSSSSKVVNIPVVERLVKKPGKTRNLAAVKRRSILRKPSSSTASSAMSAYRVIPKVGNFARKSWRPVAPLHSSRPIATGDGQEQGHGKKQRRIDSTKKGLGHTRNIDVMDDVNQTMPNAEAVNGNEMELDDIIKVEVLRDDEDEDQKQMMTMEEMEYSRYQNEAEHGDGLKFYIPCASCGVDIDAADSAEHVCASDLQNSVEDEPVSSVAKSPASTRPTTTPPVIPMITNVQSLEVTHSLSQRQSNINRYKKSKQYALKRTVGRVFPRRSMPQPNDPLAIHNDGSISFLVNIPAVDRLVKKPKRRISKVHPEPQPGPSEIKRFARLPGKRQIIQKNPGAEFVSFSSQKSIKRHRKKIKSKRGRKKASLDPLKTTSDSDHDDYCLICRDGGADLLCCESCTRVFHPICHIPALSGIPDGAFICNLCKSKADACDSTKQSENHIRSTTSTGIHGDQIEFYKACKFLSEIFRLENDYEVRLLVDVIGREQLDFSESPLFVVRERLTDNKPLPFSDAKEMLEALEDVFQSYADVLKKKMVFTKLDVANKFDVAFNKLLREYYPDYRRTRLNIENEMIQPFTLPLGDDNEPAAGSAIPSSPSLFYNPEHVDNALRVQQEDIIRRYRQDPTTVSPQEIRILEPGLKTWTILHGVYHADARVIQGEAIKNKLNRQRFAILEENQLARSRPGTKPLQKELDDEDEDEKQMNAAVKRRSILKSPAESARKPSSSTASSTSDDSFSQVSTSSSMSQDHCFPLHLPLIVTPPMIFTPFLCSMCGKSFETRSLLTRHKPIHKGAFRCNAPGCNVTFRNQMTLTKHRIDKH